MIKMKHLIQISLVILLISSCSLSWENNIWKVKDKKECWKFSTSIEDTTNNENNNLAMCLKNWCQITYNTEDTSKFTCMNKSGKIVTEKPTINWTIWKKSQNRSRYQLDSLFWKKCIYDAHSYKGFSRTFFSPDFTNILQHKLVDWNTQVFYNWDLVWTFNQPSAPFFSDDSKSYLFDGIKKTTQWSEQMIVRDWKKYLWGVLIKEVRWFHSTNINMLITTGKDQKWDLIFNWKSTQRYDFLDTKSLKLSSDNNNFVIKWTIDNKTIILLNNKIIADENNLMTILAINNKWKLLYTLKNNSKKPFLTNKIRLQWNETIIVPNIKYIDSFNTTLGWENVWIVTVKENNKRAFYFNWNFWKEYDDIKSVKYIQDINTFAYIWIKEWKEIYVEWDSELKEYTSIFTIKYSPNNNNVLIAEEWENYWVDIYLNHKLEENLPIKHPYSFSLKDNKDYFYLGFSNNLKAVSVKNLESEKVWRLAKPININTKSFSFVTIDESNHMHYTHTCE